MIGPELKIQLDFRKKAKWLCPKVRLVAVPNGTYIASKTGRRNAQLEGISSGFPDIIAMWANGEGVAAVPGMALIEFKSAVGRLSDTQKEWGDWLERSGFPYIVSRDADSALDWLKSVGAPFVRLATDADAA